MGDVRTERGDLVPERWAELYTGYLPEAHRRGGEAQIIAELITELSLALAALEEIRGVARGDKDGGVAWIHHRAANTLAAAVSQNPSSKAKGVTELASWQARAEQAESTIAAWKKDAEDRDKVIAELTEQNAALREANRINSDEWRQRVEYLKTELASRSTDLEREDGK